MDSTTINNLLQVLADRGLSDDAIVNVRDGLWAQANETFMDQVVAALTNDDLQQVEACATQEEADQKFAQLYREKTGKDMQEEMQSIVDQFASELIAKYKVDDGVLPPASYSNDMSEKSDDSFFPKDDQPAVSLTSDIPEVPPVPPLNGEDEKPEEDKIHDLS